MDTVKESALSPQLQAALTLARASPDALLAPPAWVESVIKAGMGYAQKLADWDAQYLSSAQPKWSGLPPPAQARYGSVQAFATAGWAKPRGAFLGGLDLSVAAVRGEFKWNAVFNNDNGDLPGTAGLGGYREYYAEPDPAHVGPTAGPGGKSGTWGKNRVLHKVDDVGGYRDSWWVTDDHYVNFKLVVA